MVKLNNIKKVWISIIIFCIAVLFGSTPTQAVYFSGWKSGSNSLWTSREFYCIEHQDYFTAGNWNKVSEQVITSNDPSQANRALAYILRDAVRTGDTGYNGKGAHQYAVWRWYYNNGTNTKYPGESAIYNAGMSQPQIKYSNSKSNISVSNKTITMTGEIGSFKFTELSGTISEFEMTWADGTKKVLKQNEKIGNWIEFYSDNKCTKPLKVADIKKNQTVYFKNVSNQQIKNIKATVNNQASGYKVTISRYKKSTGQASQQDLISAKVEEGKNTSVSVTMNIKYTYGNIQIKKIGVYTEDGKKITDKNVKATFKLYCNTLGKWVSGDASAKKTYVDNINKATEYKSNTTVTKLFSTYKYELVEVNVDNDEYKPIKMVGVTSNLQKGLTVGKNGEYYSAKGITIYNNKTNVVTPADERATGNLKILKVDNNHKDIVLSGAEFIIKKEGTENWIIKNSNGTYNYNGKYEDIVNNKSGVYTTNAQGIAEIKKLKFDTYHIYEIKAPDGYNIEKQDKYDKDKKWIDLGTVTLGGKDTNITYTVTNKKVVDKLEGNVWIDNPDTKANEYDNIYIKESNDKLLKDIKVYLKDKDQVIAETKTDESGHYEFTTKNRYNGEDKNLYYWEMAGYHVEFAYDNKAYVVVDPFVGNDTKMNSKAKEEIMTKAELEDEKLTGTDGENPGRAVTYKGGINLNTTDIINNNKAQNKDLSKTPLTGYYNNNTYTIENINLGIKEKHEPTFNISENLEYIKVRINGYTYKYQHGPNAGKPFTYTPKVATQISGTRFSQILYPSDIAYKSEDASKNLSVFVVYSIAIKNNDTTDIDDIYNEKTLYLKSLVNSYDNDRYVLCRDENTSDSSDFALWTESKDENGNNYAVYDIAKGKYNAGIKKGDTITTQIQFRINDEHLRKMLERSEDAQNGLENAPTVAKASAYHEYLRTDNVWNEEASAKAFDGIKGKYEENNKANETYFAHKSVSKEEVSSNVFIDIMLGESRKISGVVFEDVALENSNLGNGTLDNGENNRAKDVKVELLDIDKTTIAKLYQVDKVNNYVVKLKQDSPKDGIVSSSEDGTYTFDGVVPGYYYIRFTYGDGKQLMMPANEAITSKNYKSTIIKNETIRNAMEAKTQEEAMKLANWYKNQGAKNNSTAVDDLAQRKAIDGYTYNADGTITDKDGKTATDIMNINSYTPMIGISVENDEDDVKDVKQDENGKDITEYQNEYTGFNFGLIKHPDTPVIVEKKITNVKFTNQAGTTLVSENPASRQSTYVTALDKIEGGSTNAKLEIEPENIYGSNIELTYEIKITNNSDFDDYTEESYYKYGESGKTKKTIQVQVLEDDLDNKFNYASLPKTTTQTKSSASSDSNVITLEPVTETINNEDGSTSTKQYVKMTGWEKLAKDESTSTSYTVTALVANDDTDSAYNNDAKVQSLSVDTLTTLTTESMKKWEEGKAQFTIMPTTGENRNQTYLYVEAIALAIIASGLILIKKKVL